MKILLGILFIMAGIFFGLYVGVYICLWGGAVSMYTGLVTASFWTFIWGAIKWAIAGTLGGIIFWIFGAVGAWFFE